MPVLYFSLQVPEKFKQIAHTLVRYAGGRRYNSRELVCAKRWRDYSSYRLLSLVSMQGRKSKKKKPGKLNDLTFHLLQIDIHFKG